MFFIDWLRAYINGISSNTQSPFFLLITVPVLFIAIAICASQWEIHVRCLVIFIFAVVLFEAFQHNRTLFLNADPGHILRDYSLNLSTQFAAALLLPFIYAGLLKHQLFFQSTLTAIGLLCVGLGLVAGQESCPAAQVESNFCANLGMEFVGGTVTFLVLAVGVLLVHVLRLILKPSERRRTLTPMIMMGVCVIVLRVMVHFVLSADPQMESSFVVTVASMALTLLIFCGWTTDHRWTFPLVTLAIIFGAIYILSNTQHIGQDKALSITGELVGSLITTALLEKGWVWPEKVQLRKSVSAELRALS